MCGEKYESIVLAYYALYLPCGQNNRQGLKGGKLTFLAGNLLVCYNLLVEKFQHCYFVHPNADLNLLSIVVKLSNVCKILKQLGTVHFFPSPSKKMNIALYFNTINLLQ